MKFIDYFWFLLDGGKSTKEIIAERKISVQQQKNDPVEVFDQVEVDDFRDEIFFENEEFFD